MFTRYVQKRDVCVLQQLLFTVEITTTTKITEKKKKLQKMTEIKSNKSLRYWIVCIFAGEGELRIWDHVWDWSWWNVLGWHSM